MPTVPELIADLDDEYDATRLLVAPLTRSDRRWDRATPAEGWAVRDQISHLAFFDGAGRRAIEEPDAFGREAELALSGQGDPMAVHLVKGRAMDGDQLLDWWAEAHAGLVDALSEIGPDQRIPWYGPPMGSLSFVTARLMETWAHGQDVADALGVDRAGTDRLRHIADLGVRTRLFSYAVRGRTPPPARIAVRLTAPSGASWDWQIGDGAAGAPAGGSSAAGGAGPASSVRGPALDFCLLVTQRRNVADTSLVVVGADAEDWISIAQAFAGPPGPGRPPREDHGLHARRPSRSGPGA